MCSNAKISEPNPRSLSFCMSCQFMHFIEKSKASDKAKGLGNKLINVSFFHAMAANRKQNPPTFQWPSSKYRSSPIYVGLIMSKKKTEDTINMPCLYNT